MSTSDYSLEPYRPPRLVRMRNAVAARPIPWDVWALGALIAVAAVIRIITIDNQSFWMDESLTAYEARLPLGAMLTTWSHVETTPPLYFVVIWVWGHVFGTSEIALRSVSTLAGIALVPIAYLSARELVSRAAGVAAAAFVVFNPFLIWYSQEARSYMLLAALSGAAFLFFARSLRDPSRRNLAWWALFASLSVMTHFFAGFAAAPEAVWLLWRARSRAATVAAAVVAVAQVAMLPIAVSDTTHGTDWVAHVPRLHRIAIMILEWSVSLLERRGTMAMAFGGVVALAVVLVLLLTLGAGREARRGAMVAAVVAGVVFIGPLVLALFGQDYFLSRNEIPAIVPLSVVLAAACTASRVRVAGAVVATALIVMFAVATVVVQTHSRYQRPDWRAVAAALDSTNRTRAILAADGVTADPLKIYMPGVSWTQPHGEKVLVNEIDVIGATKKLALVGTGGAVRTASVVPPTLWGRPIPRSVAPEGARLIARFRVDNWVIARFALDRPQRLSINQLVRQAPLYFRHTPAALLIFTQHPAG